MSITTTGQPVGRAWTLADRAIGHRTLALSALLVVAGAGLVGVSAQIAIPLWPVPITGQTLAVLLVGSALGAARGALSLTVYAVAGVIGVPWFSDASAGLHVLVGPTGGYIVGFVAAAAVTGWLAERQWDRRFLRALAVFVAGTVVPFAVGLPWLAIVLGLDLPQTLQAGLYPFLIGGVIKALIAAALLPGCWALLNRAKR